jgi:alpha-glucosidase
MWLRSAPDGEAEYVEAVIDRRTEDEGWWRADLIIHNQDTNYRVLLDGGRSPIGG